MTDELKSYFVIDIGDFEPNTAEGPFDTRSEAMGCIAVIGSVKRTGMLVITECERIEELQQLDVHGENK